MFEVVAKADKEFEIMMYGAISQWEKVNAKDFVKSMNEAVGAGAKKIILPTHCPGGSIYEGLAMGTSIRQARAKGIKVIQRVDGISASMSAVIGSCCDEVEVAPFTRIMVHEGRGGIWGTVTQLRAYADQLEKDNKDMAQIHSEKVTRLKPELKRDAEWVLKNWMSEGRDTWFSADDAIKEGLADRKIGAVVKALPKIEASMNWLEVAATLDKHFFDKPESTIMKREELIALLGLSADATEAQIETAFKAMKAKADAAAVADPAKDKDKPEDKTNADQTKVIDGVVALAKERGADEKLIASIKKIAALDVNAAMEMIPAKKAENPVDLQELIAKLKTSGGAEGGADARASWTFDDWQNKDAKGFEEMLAKKPEDYIKLFEAKFGYKPTLTELQGRS
jgi:ATP-dependent protease ClpP protease subunit